MGGGSHPPNYENIVFLQGKNRRCKIYQGFSYKVGLLNNSELAKSDFGGAKGDFNRAKCHHPPNMEHEVTFLDVSWEIRG